jgi:hypothetical protein
MKEIPRFHVEEGWDNQSILISWQDIIPQKIVEFINGRLLYATESTVYNADCVITKTLNFLIDNKYLMKSPITKTWIMRREVADDYYTCKWSRM